MVSYPPDNTSVIDRRKNPVCGRVSPFHGEEKRIRGTQKPCERPISWASTCGTVSRECSVLRQRVEESNGSAVALALRACFDSLAHVEVGRSIQGQPNLPIIHSAFLDNVNRQFCHSAGVSSPFLHGIARRQACGTRPRCPMSHACHRRLSGPQPFKMRPEGSLP